MKDNLKERLNTQRINKTLIWQTMLLTMGGSLGLLIKALNSKTNWLEIVLMVMGFIIVTFLAYLIGSISNNMEVLHNKLKEEALKNE